MRLRFPVTCAEAACARATSKKYCSEEMVWLTRSLYHPGGKKSMFVSENHHVHCSGWGANLLGPVLQKVAGKDASKQFWKYHNEAILKKYKEQLQVGSLDTKQPATAAQEPPSVRDGVASKPKPPTSTVPVWQGSEPQEPFGDLIPFADPSWYQGVCGGVCCS